MDTTGRLFDEREIIGQYHPCYIGNDELEQPRQKYKRFYSYITVKYLAKYVMQIFESLENIFASIRSARNVFFSLLRHFFFLVTAKLL